MTRSWPWARRPLRNKTKDKGKIMLSYEEVSLSKSVGNRLIQLSADWAAENSCYGYRTNGLSDIEGNRIFTAQDNGEIIGYLFGNVRRSSIMKTIMPEDTPFFEVEELYIAKEYRSRGIGSALFRFAQDKVKTEAEYMVLSTATKNWKAILHFYLDELGMEFWSARLFKKIN